MRLSLTELIVIAMGFVLLAFAGIANAQPEGSRPMVVDGVPGAWFPLETVRSMTADLDELPSLRRQLSIMEDRLELKIETIGLLTQNVNLTEQQAAHWRNALEAALKRADRKPGLFATPAFTFVVGFVSAGVFAVAMVYGLDLVVGGR